MLCMLTTPLHLLPPPQQARMEVEANTQRAADLEQRMEGLQEATQVRAHKVPPCRCLTLSSYLSRDGPSTLPLPSVPLVVPPTSLLPPPHTFTSTHVPPPSPHLPPPQVSSADEGRIKELQRSVSNEKVALLDLKEQCAGLEKQATSLQVG